MRDGREIEVDKIAGAWVVTHWLPDDITLRLKIYHSSAWDPDECVAEVRLRDDEEFQVIHEFSMCPYLLLHSDELPGEGNDMPKMWIHEFAVMAKTWARLTMIADFGNSDIVRYASEPQSSRDHLIGGTGP
jgi:hypothetical protein